MDILISASSLLAPPSGVGRYTRKVSEHLESLAPEYSYSYSYGFFSSRRLLQGLPTKLLQYAHACAARVRPLMRPLRRLRRQAGGTRPQGRPYDVYFETDFAAFDVQAKRRVVMIHDFSFHRHPEWHPRDRVEFLRRHFMPRARAADAIVTASRFVQQEAEDILGIDGRRISVIPEGVDRQLFRPYPRETLEEFRLARRLPEHFVLCVGNLEPRKNLLRLFQAYEALPSSLRQAHPLVLAGFRGWNNRDLLDRLDSSRDVHCLGYVTDLDLAFLYNLTTLFVYPSLYEGFGLPPLEAMACGAPVAASIAGSLPEVLSDAAAYFDPEDIDEMAGTLRRLLEQSGARRELFGRGLARAAGFQWTDTAVRLLEVFKSAQPSFSAA